MAGEVVPKRIAAAPASAAVISRFMLTTTSSTRSGWRITHSYEPVSPTSSASQPANTTVYGSEASFMASTIDMSEPTAVQLSIAP